jgi:hypothetical protein
MHGSVGVGKARAREVGNEYVGGGESRWLPRAHRREVVEYDALEGAQLVILCIPRLYHLLPPLGEDIAVSICGRWHRSGGVRSCLTEHLTDGGGHRLRRGAEESRATGSGRLCAK